MKSPRGQWVNMLKPKFCDKSICVIVKQIHFWLFFVCILELLLTRESVCQHIIYPLRCCYILTHIVGKTTTLLWWSCTVFREQWSGIILALLESGISQMARSIPWLLMPWFLASPVHQLSQYYLCRIYRSLSVTRKDFNYLCHTSLEKWKKYKYIFMFHKFSLTMVNSLWPSDVIWRQRTWSTLVQVMACCLTAPNHYLNQCWLIISDVLWHSQEMITISTLIWIWKFLI